MSSVPARRVGSDVRRCSVRLRVRKKYAEIPPSPKTTAATRQGAVSTGRRRYRAAGFRAGRRLTLADVMKTPTTRARVPAKSKLALADSWYREAATRPGAGSRPSTRISIQFYPSNWRKPARPQEKVCKMRRYQSRWTSAGPATRCTRGARKTNAAASGAISETGKFAPDAQQIPATRRNSRGLGNTGWRFYYRSKEGVSRRPTNRLNALTTSSPSQPRR